MDIEINLTIEHKRKHVISISRRESVPNGLYTVEPIDTVIKLTENYGTYSLALSIDQFDLSSKLAKVSYYKAIKLEELMPIEKIHNLASELKEAGWTVNLKEEVVSLILNPPVPITLSEDKQSIKSPQKPSLKTLAGTMLTILAFLLGWYGYKAGWDIQSTDFYSAIIISVTGATIGHVLNLIVYQHKQKKLKSINDDKSIELALKD